MNGAAFLSLRCLERQGGDFAFARFLAYILALR